MEFRRPWLETVVRSCQAFTGRVIVLENTDELLSTARAWIDSLPDPVSRAEDLALRGMLCDVALRWGASVHDRVHHAHARRRCGFNATYGFDRFVARGHRAAKDSFRKWARIFSTELLRTHPITAAQRAAAIIREQKSDDCDIPRIAHKVGVTPDRLRRMFRRERGMTLPEYIRRVRLLRALDVLSNRASKIEPLALEVGYRSKKNFYRVFKQLTGVMPLEFKRLPADSARQIVEATRLGLLSSPRSIKVKEA